MGNYLMDSSEHLEVILGVEDSALPVSEVISLLDGIQNMTLS